jgi:MYXO-CTERM domain-containing protein
MRHRSIAALVGAALLAVAPPAAAGPGLVPLDLAPLASIDVSRWSAATFGFSELEAGPGALRDGNPTTSWEVPGADGEDATVTFDWSSPNAVDPFPVGSIRVDMKPADAAVTVRAGRDLGNLADAAADVARDDAGATITLRGSPRLRVLSLRFPAGTSVKEVQIFGGPTNGKLGDVSATCDGDGVHLALHGAGLLGVEATRALPQGGALRLAQRRAAGAVLTDATVRFDARPATYSYLVTGIGTQDPPASVSVTCTGTAKARPAAGPIHGVIEGFYGRPWTWPERMKVVRAMGALGMDTYIYAPKDDPRHRAHWRDAYEAADMDRFRDLASLGRGVGVNVVWAISPGLDIDPSSQADIDALTGKVAAMAGGAGIRDAALLMDDISAAHDASLGAAHAGLVQTLLASMKARDPASRLWFVPTVYAGLASSFSATDLAYLGALAAVPPEVPIAWTGAGVFATSIEITDAGAFGALTGRDAGRVWIWDNYPVNDVAVFRRLYTSPIIGRDSLLPESAGVLSNPMRHALASIPAIASYAEMALDPAAYAAARTAGEPLDAAKLALVLADAEGAPRALGDLFAELVHHDTLWPDAYASPGLTAALAAYAAAPTPGSARRAAAKDLAERLARLAIADVDLRRDLDDAALSDEIDAHARATSVTARAALEGLAAARADALGDAKESALAASRSACLWLAANEPSWRTVQDALAPLMAQGDTSGCAASGDPFTGPPGAPLVAQRGKAWSHAFTDAVTEKGAIWSLVGPEGAAISADGRVTWTPPRLGRFRLVALRSGDAGTSAQVLDVLVTEPPATENGVVTGGCGCRAAPGGGSGAALLIAAAAALLRRRRR